MRPLSSLASLMVFVGWALIHNIQMPDVFVRLLSGGHELYLGYTGVSTGDDQVLKLVEDWPGVGVDSFICGYQHDVID